MILISQLNYWPSQLFYETAFFKDLKKNLSSHLITFFDCNFIGCVRILQKSCPEEGCWFELPPGSFSRSFCLLIGARNSVPLFSDWLNSTINALLGTDSFSLSLSHWWINFLPRTCLSHYPPAMAAKRIEIRITSGKIKRGRSSLKEI